MAEGTDRYYLNEDLVYYVADRYRSLQEQKLISVLDDEEMKVLQVLMTNWFERQDQPCYECTVKQCRACQIEFLYGYRRDPEFPRNTRCLHAKVEHRCLECRVRKQFKIDFHSENAANAKDREA